MTGPRDLFTRRVLFVGGKGGVGKTTIAAALAVASADRSTRTLLVSTDPAHSTSDIVGTVLGDEPTPIGANLWGLEIDPEAEADRYIAEVKGRLAGTVAPRLQGEVDRQVDIARLSPGAAEAALFDRFARLLAADDSPYDRIVFDTAPTGHTLRLLTLPETMAAWMGGLIQHRTKVNRLARMWRRVAGTAAGREDGEPADPVLSALQTRQRRFARARDVITDATSTAFVFVVIPERLPIFETVRAVCTLDRYRVPVGGIYVNQILPDDGSAGFLTKRRERQTSYLDTIRSDLGDHPLWYIPLMASDPVGIDALRELGSVVAGDA